LSPDYLPKATQLALAPSFWQRFSPPRQLTKWPSFSKITSLHRPTECIEPSSLQPSAAMQVPTRSRVPLNGCCGMSHGKGNSRNLGFGTAPSNGSFEEVPCALIQSLGVLLSNGRHPKTSLLNRLAKSECASR
jgi:hypothetical protein